MNVKTAQKKANAAIILCGINKHTIDRTSLKTCQYRERGVWDEVREEKTDYNEEERRERWWWWWGK